MAGTLIVGLAGLVWVASFGWLLTMSGLALLQPLRRRRAPARSQLPPVSVVMPTSAVENGRSRAARMATLRSLLELEAGASEILVCVDRGRLQPAIGEELAAESGRVRVIDGTASSSANAKVDAMASGADAARYELILFSDDNVRLDRSHLVRMVAQLDGKVGLVSAAVVGTDPGNFWGELELWLMNGQFARMHLAGDCLGQGGLSGKSILMRRSDLARAGGLLPTGRDCCEDAALTRNFSAIGLCTVLGDRPVRQPVGRLRFAEVWRRHRRWLSCRRKYIPGTFACEALFCAPIACLAGAVALGPLIGSAAAALGTALLWCALDCAFVIAKGWPFSPLTPLAWLVHEAILLPLWVSALFARTVSWHGRLVPVAD